MAPTSQPRPDLEKSIPKNILNNVKRECSRPECQSRNVVMRYFNNNKHDQPRFFCNNCKRLFTLGGKLRESYKKAKNKTQKAILNARTRNLQTEGVEIRESSGLARWIQTKTSSSRRGLSQTTNRVANGTQTKTKSLEDIEDEEETNDYEDFEEEFEEEMEIETGDEDGGEDEEMYQAIRIEQLGKGDKELVDLKSTEETPMVLDTNLSEEPHFGMLLKIEELRMKAKKYLLDAQITLEELCIEKWSMQMELEWREIEQLQERENRELYPDEEMLYTLKHQVVKVVSLWLVGPLNGTRHEMLAAREASLEKVDQSIKSLAREVHEMENTFVPHAMMVKIEKKAKRLWDRVVALVD